jgi:hypothetical protein
VEIRVRPVGISFDQLSHDVARRYKAANRQVGRGVAKVGKAAIRKGAPRMWGKPLTCKTKVDSWSDHAEVTFQAQPAGGWAIAESGARPHPIAPRSRKALAFNGRFAAHVAHPGSGGHKAWSKAGQRLAAAIEPEIQDTYDRALGV